MRTSSHANCCGITPITVVGDATLDSDDCLNKLVGIVQAQSEEPGKVSNRMFEIVLNDTQANSAPRLLELMAKLGFVFTARMNNGVHDSWVNVFQRVQRNGRPYVKPKFNYGGLNLSDQLADYQIEPVKFKRAEVPNPFMKSSVFAYA